MAEIIQLSEGDARTMNALRLSIDFYKKNNKDGRYDRALLKEQKMLKFYFQKVRGELPEMEEAA